jgi:hypothetical protein
MRRLTLIFLLAVTLFSHRAMAAVLTVYNLNNTAIATYSTIGEAYNNASEGDTIVVYPSELSYQAITVTKKVFLIGGGYASQTLFPPTNISGTMTFSAGSDGSSIESFGGRFNVAINTTSNILISRCNINCIVVDNGFNILMTGNWIDGNSGPEGYALTIRGTSLVEGSNNLIRPKPYPCGYSSTCYYGAVHLIGNVVLHMDNSIFISEGQLTIYGEGGTASGKNNLLFGGFRAAVDFHHSILTNSWEGSLDIAKYNQIIPDVNVVYTDFAANIFTLKPGSPAFGNGENGSDISIYDGATPFVDGGFPKLPRIWSLDVPLTGSQTEGINVTIKVKSND